MLNIDEELAKNPPKEPSVQKKMSRTGSYESSEDIILNQITVSLIIKSTKTIKNTSFLFDMKFTIGELITKSIKSFNEQFVIEKAKFQINKEPENYILKESDDEGVPLPLATPLNRDLKVSTILCRNFTLLWDKEPENYSIYFIYSKSLSLFDKCQDLCNIY